MKPLIPLYNLGYPIQHLGFPMMQNRQAPVLWSYLLEKLAPATIIEIGTHDGGFAICLALAASRMRARFVTYDINAYLQANTPWFDMLKIDFRRMNVFSPDSASVSVQQLLAQPGRAFLLCDGGDKVREFNTFAPFLKPGDLIAAHDYMDDHDYWCCSEVHAEDVTATMSAQGLVALLPEFALQCAWLVATKGEVAL